MEKELSYEEEQEQEIRDYIMKNIHNTIENSLQHENEVEMIIKINEENNYLYDIESDNLIDCRLLCKLLRYGYVVIPYGDKMILRHKNKMKEGKNNE